MHAAHTGPSTPLFSWQVSLPLVHLMDMEAHRAWYPLTDPQGKADLPQGQAEVSGDVLVEAKFTVW